jgi:hypothetical protein
MLHAMWEAVDLHPLRTWLIVAAASLIVADSARRTFAEDAKWPSVVSAAVFAIVVVWVTFAFAYARGHTPPETRTQVLLGLAVAPMPLGVGLAAVGIASWASWSCAFLVWGLTAWWATDKRRQGRRGHAIDNR